MDKALNLFLVWALVSAPVVGFAHEKTSPLRSWQMGLFVEGGLPPAYVYGDGIVSAKLDLQIYSAGFEVGRQTRQFDRVGLLNGRGEAVVEILPFWLARYPPQNVTVRFSGGGVTISRSGTWDGERIPGVSVTPVLLRWNFSQANSPRAVPWVQVGGGALWTVRNFPWSFGAPTSVFNFTPQAGAGINLFSSPRRSVNLAFKFIHISNAGLGDQNPALHDTVNFAVGYSWWK